MARRVTYRGRDYGPYHQAYNDPENFHMRRQGLQGLAEPALPVDVAKALVAINAYNRGQTTNAGCRAQRDLVNAAGLQGLQALCINTRANTGPPVNWQVLLYWNGRRINDFYE